MRRFEMAKLLPVTEAHYRQTDDLATAIKGAATFLDSDDVGAGEYVLIDSDDRIVQKFSVGKSTKVTQR